MSQSRDEKIEKNKKLLSDLDKRRSQALARIQKYQAQNSVERRKKETRKKILLGAWVQHKINNGDWTEEYILKEMDSYLTKKVDRRIFDLPVLSDRDNEDTGSEDNRTEIT